MMGYQRQISRLKRNLTDYGTWITFKKIIIKLASPFYVNRTYRVYTKDLSELKEDTSLNADFHFRIISAADAGAIEQIELLEEWLCGCVADKLQNGSLCLVAFDGPVVAGFNLVDLHQGELPLVHYYKKLHPYQAWSEQITVHPDYRGKRLASSLRVRMFELLKERGIRKFYGGAQISNTASLKLARSIGFVEIADVQYLKYFSWQKTICRRYRP